MKRKELIIERLCKYEYESEDSFDDYCTWEPIKSEMFTGNYKEEDGILYVEILIPRFFCTTLFGCKTIWVHENSIRFKEIVYYSCGGTR